MQGPLVQPQRQLSIHQPIPSKIKSHIRTVRHYESIYYKMRVSLIYCKEEHPLIYHFDDVECPVCLTLSERDEMRDSVEEMEEKLLRSASEIDHLEDKIANLEARI